MSWLGLLTFETEPLRDLGRLSPDREVLDLREFGVALL